jgi:hypothetical protein
MTQKFSKLHNSSQDEKSKLLKKGYLQWDETLKIDSRCIVPNQSLTLKFNKSIEDTAH